MVRVVLSFDDGSPEDEKIVKTLNKRNFGCTLFVPKFNSEGRPTMDETQLYDLSQSVEIGSHTLNHVYLNKLSIKEAIDEVSAGHSYVEEVTGVASDIFCYPGGKYSKQLDQEVQRLIKYRRTIENFSSVVEYNGLLPTFIQFYPHTRYVYFKNIIRYCKINKLKYLGSENFMAIILEKINSSNPDDIVHVWGHSWEIEELNLWKDLEYLLDYCIDIGVKVGSIGEALNEISCNSKN